jgi:hypothetical protein
MEQTEITTWGPQGCRASVSVTFDNLGEACDINMGRRRANSPVGSHVTARRVLAQLIEDVEGLGISYFIESVNVRLYPEQMKSLQAAEHEIGWHTWHHENWGRLSHARKRSNLAHILAALRNINISPVGFRPPGGVTDPPSLTLLKEHGFKRATTSGSRRVARSPDAWPLDSRTDWQLTQRRSHRHRAASLTSPGRGVS